MSSSMFPTPRTPYTKAVLAFIDEFETWDTSKIEPLLADGVEVSFMPRAMGVPTTKGKQLMLKGFVQLKPFVGVLKIEVLDYMEGSGKATIHFRAVDTVSKLDGTPYTNEWVIMFHFDSDNKMTVIKEFVDSKFVDTFYSGQRPLLAILSKIDRQSY